MSLELGSVCSDWGIVGNVELLDTPWRGIIGASKGDVPFMSVMSGGAAGTMEGDETTVVEGERLFLEVSELERLRTTEPLISMWVGATPRCTTRCDGICSRRLPESLLRRGDKALCCSRTNPRKRFRRSHLLMFTATSFSVEWINGKCGSTCVAFHHQSFFPGHSQLRQRISPLQSSDQLDGQSTIPSWCLPTTMGSRPPGLLSSP